jgi:hypothetical protein
MCPPLAQGTIPTIDPPQLDDQHPTLNTPSFHTAAASKTYHNFAATFEVCEASFFRREHVLQFPGLREQPDPDEFIADENINLREFDDATKVREDDDKTIRTSNVTGDSPPPTPDEPYEPSKQSEGRGTLTFDPSPPLEA